MILVKPKPAPPAFLIEQKKRSPVVIHPPEQPDRIAELQARRDAVHGEINRLNRPAETLAQARATLVAAEAELAEREQAKRRAWESWSLAPTGEPPEGDPEEHRTLEQRRALASADVRAGEAAVAAVEPRLSTLLNELRGIAGEIYRAKLASVVAELPEIEKALADALRAQIEQLVKRRGLAVALAEELSTALSRGNSVIETDLRSAIVRLENAREPQGGVTWGDVQAAAARWMEKLR